MKEASNAWFSTDSKDSALFYALYAPPDVRPKDASYPIRYFVNVSKKLNREEEEWDNCIESRSENDRTKDIEIDLGSGMKKVSFKELLDWAGNFENLLNKIEFKRHCYEEGKIPFAILKERSALDDWLEDFGDYHSKKGVPYEEVKERKKNIKNIFETWFKFKVPSLTLENKPLNEVAEIFERINRTGVELSVFALATAVFFKKGVNLRNWWKEYYDMAENPVRNFCEEDDEEYPKSILQIMALRQGKEVKKKILVNSKELTIDKEKWDKACGLLSDALRRLQNTTTGYGVIRPDLLPYKPIIVTLASLLEHCKTQSDFRKLDAWYWSSVFTERYAGASDTAIKQDFDQVKEWLVDDNKKPIVIVQAQNKINEINLRNTDRGALYKAILNIIALNGAKDFYSGQSIELIRLNDHHVFPKKSGIKLTNENSILNRTLIQESTNKEIIKKKPSEYIEEMRNKLGNEDKVKEVLRTHLIDEKSFVAMENDNYEEFLKAREESIVAEMLNRIKSIKDENEKVEQMPYEVTNFFIQGLFF